MLRKLKRSISPASYKFHYDPDAATERLCSLSPSHDLIEQCLDEKLFDALQYLISKQSATGCFQLENDDIDQLSVTQSKWQDLLQAIQGMTTVKPNLVASTLAALALLESRFAARSDEWQMLADKAERWLAKQSLSLPPGETSATSWAKGMLNL